MESIYALSTGERKLTEGRSILLEDITMRNEASGARSKGETVPKEQREKKMQEVEASTLGVKVFAAATNRFLEKINIRRDSGREQKVASTK